MKDVTLREFIEIAKDNEDLKSRVAECVKATRGGKLPDDLVNLAAGAGYQLKELNLAGLAGNRQLSDDALATVSGGDSFIEKSAICEFIIGMFGWDTTDCYD